MGEALDDVACADDQWVVLFGGAAAPAPAPPRSWPLCRRQPFLKGHFSGCGHKVGCRVPKTVMDGPDFAVAVTVLQDTIDPGMQPRLQ